jgi:hypothetical protein
VPIRPWGVSSDIIHARRTGSQTAPPSSIAGFSTSILQTAQPAEMFPPGGKNVWDPAFELRPDRRRSVRFGRRAPGGEGHGDSRGRKESTVMARPVPGSAAVSGRFLPCVAPGPGRRDRRAARGGCLRFAGTTPVS